MRIIYTPKAKDSYKSKRIERAEKADRRRKRKFKERMRYQFGIA